MTGAESGQIIALIACAWPRHPFSRETAALYGRMMADFSIEETVTAVQALIRELTFPPTIADIRKAVIKNRCSLPDPQRAWMLVCLRYGASKGNGDRGVTLAPVVIAALDAAGIDSHRLHTSENRHWVKQSFLDIYTVMWNDALKWEDEGSRILEQRKGLSDGDAGVGPHLGLDAAGVEGFPQPSYAVDAGWGGDDTSGI